MISEHIKIGEIFTFNFSFHQGRTYQVKRFDADKFGARMVVCEWLEEKGFKTSYLIYLSELQSRFSVKGVKNATN